MTTDPIQVLVRHEDTLLQAGLAALLARFSDLAVMPDDHGAVDVVITDYAQALHRIRREGGRGAGPRIVVLTRRGGCDAGPGRSP